MQREEKPLVNFGSSFYMLFVVSLSLPYVKWDSQEGVCFTLCPHSCLGTLFCSVFFQAFPFFVFQSPPFWTSFSYSNYLTKCSLDTPNFLDEITSLSHSIVFLYFFALITQAGFLISLFYSLELCIQMAISICIHKFQALSFLVIPYS